MQEGNFKKNAGANYSQQSKPAVWWATVGVAILAFQLFVLGKWITGPYFVATDPGPDPISSQLLLYYKIMQTVIPLLAIFVLWNWLFKPWLREGRMTTDGRLTGAFVMIFFWDMGMNYSSTALFYNSHLINRGSWTLGSWPTWFSPNGNLLPEPLFITLPGYTALVFTQCLFICWVLRKTKARYPNLGVAASIGIIVVGLTIVDSIIEIFLLQTQIYAYPGVIRAVTLFAGETYQFPLTEGFLFGGLGAGATAALSYFRDDKGSTFAERGVERLKINDFSKQVVRFFAVFGFVHGSFFALYTVPNQWISLNTDPFPKAYPSWLVNNMCVYGINHNECPGPGVMMPRPPFKP